MLLAKVEGFGECDSLRPVLLEVQVLGFRGVPPSLGISLRGFASFFVMSSSRKVCVLVFFVDKGL